MNNKIYLYIYFILHIINGIKSQGQDAGWIVNFNSSSIAINMYSSNDIHVKIQLTNDSLKSSEIRFYCDKSYICDTLSDNIKLMENNWEGNLKIKGIFLGRTKICSELKLSNRKVVISNECLNVVVLKEIDVLDTIFTVSLGVMVMIVFISFGACLDTDSIKDILLKPVGPIIGFSSQFILMPILSFFFGYILFYDDINMWLGIFFAGVSPGGGASNMWTLMLRGDVNLSIVMTTISNLAAFVMMPLWIFTLGRKIFEHGNLGVPYERIAVFSVSLIIPLLMGIGIQKFQPKISKLLVRFLKPITIIILIYIMIFATLTNLYIFQLFTWKIMLAGMCLPWCGYILGFLFAWLFRQNKVSCLTISIETGLQNTGIAIFLLRFSLEQPEADLTSVVPVAVAVMTMIPLIALYLIQKIYFLCENEKEIQEISYNPKEEDIKMQKY